VVYRWLNPAVISSFKERGVWEKDRQLWENHVIVRYSALERTNGINC
jgi:hypothetical protein